MSISSQRGKQFEQEVASIIRKKLGARVARDRRSGAGTNKSDISDYYQEIPFAIECKDQETLKVKEWMQQAIDAASFTQVPTLVFRMDTEIIAAVRFADLVNLAVEIADLRAEIADLRTPSVVALINKKIESSTYPAINSDATPIPTKKQIVSTDPNGHIVDRFGYCNQKGCKFSRGYKAPKAKKK